MANDLVGTFGIAAKDGTVTGEMHRWMKGQQRQAAELGAGKASVTQTGFSPWFIEYPDAKDYRVIINSPVAFVINSVTTRSSTGTCTLTVKINTTALGGTANSVSSTESTQSHSSANAVSVGDDVVFTVSGVSGAENVSILLNCTLTLAA